EIVMDAALFDDITQKETTAGGHPKCQPIGRCVVTQVISQDHATGAGHIARSNCWLTWNEPPEVARHKAHLVVDAAANRHAGKQRYCLPREKARLFGVGIFSCYRAENQ